jgi:hypothetical protein
MFNADWTQLYKDLATVNRELSLDLKDKMFQDSQFLWVVSGGDTLLLQRGVNSHKGDVHVSCWNLPDVREQVAFSLLYPSVKL